MAAKPRKPYTVLSVEEGYEKLAMGSINDVVHLVTQPADEPVEAEGLDLFNIKEIQTNRDGIQVKFYDRLEALRCLDLLRHRQEERREGRVLLEALGSGGKISPDEPS